MYVQIVTTCDRKAVLEKIADRLLTDRLAACVQIAGPMESHYRWQGKIEHSVEWMCQIKTRRSCYDAIVERIIELHSYDEPEIIATEITGSRGYLKWIDEQVQDEG